MVSPWREALSLLFLRPIAARTHAQEPYIPTGPHTFAASGPSGPIEYRDVVIGEQPSALFAAGFTARGFSLSGWLAQDLTDRSDRAHEFFVTYSHKLPLAN